MGSLLAGLLVLSTVAHPRHAAAQGSQVERDRIRIAAEATAAPNLRVALEKASAREIDDEELGEALLELEANEGS